ncbi:MULTISPECIES: TetR family transcriptional regulator [unclassified Streptomyces]|uniref:TetR/AcrR family transcriptional regulator n=1 Tax=unclassified Streptomyces TaxID=2593676 RepID=UPI0033308848
MTGPTAPSAAGPPARRRGRPSRAESAGTRDRILAAAREEFSARGYDRTSVRRIAQAAGVDSALVHHYFGTKEQVFAAAVEVAFAPAVFRRLVAAQLVRRTAARLDLPDAELRAELAAAQLVGTALLRHVLKLEPLASADLEEIIARVSPVVQKHLTQP